LTISEVLIGPLIESAKQVPALAVLAFLTWKFLTHMKEREDKFAETLYGIGENCHEQARDLTNRYLMALERNSDALKTNTETLGEVKEALRSQRAAKER